MFLSTQSKRILKQHETLNAMIYVSVSCLAGVFATFVGFTIVKVCTA